MIYYISVYYHLSVYIFRKTRQKNTREAGNPHFSALKPSGTEFEDQLPGRKSKPQGSAAMSGLIRRFKNSHHFAGVHDEDARPNPGSDSSKYMYIDSDDLLSTGYSNQNRRPADNPPEGMSSASYKNLGDNLPGASWLKPTGNSNRDLPWFDDFVSKYEPPTLENTIII